VEREHATVSRCDCAAKAFDITTCVEWMMRTEVEVTRRQSQTCGHFMVLWWHISARGLGADASAFKKCAKNNSHPAAATYEYGRSGYCMGHVAGAACAEARTCVRALLLRDRHPLPTATPHATFSYTPDVIPRPRAHSLPFFCVNIEFVYYSFVRSRPRSPRRPSVRDLHPHPLQAKPVSTAAVVPCFPTLAVEAAGAVQRCPLRDTLEKSLTASSRQLSIHRYTTSTPRSTSEQRI
jgi:hypothetical protein